MASDVSRARPDPTERRVTPLDWVLANTVRSPLRLVALVFLAYLVWVAYVNVAAGRYTLELFLNNLLVGLAQGSIYALIALGYTLVYGILFMINFAHGEVFMAGAYIGFFSVNIMAATGLLESATWLALLLTLAVGMLASVGVAVTLERIAYRPLRYAPRLVPLITAIGASIALQQLFLRLFGASPRTYPVVRMHVPWLFPCAETTQVNGETVCLGVDLISGRYNVVLGDLTLRLRPIYLLVFVLSLVLMGVLWFIIQRTRTGRAMRAVAEDKGAASLMGVNVDNVIVSTFTLGAALAGAAGVLFALYNRQVSPFMGFRPGLKAFTAAVLGGIGNIPGAMAGGMILGLVESVVPSLLGLNYQLQDVVAFGILVLILIFRPTGIFGEALSEKKA